MTVAGAGPAEPRARSVPSLAVTVPGHAAFRRRRVLAGPAVRASVAALVGALAIGGCTPAPIPPTEPPPTPTPAPTLADDGVPTLRFALAADPGGFLPLAPSADTRRVQDFLYDSLYRLDEALRPVPVLAADAPRVSKDGKTWAIPIRNGVTFSDETALDPDDVVTTLRLARSPACPFGDVCRLAAAHISDARVDGDAVVLTLPEPWSPLLATVLADLPILPADGLQASLERFLAGAAALERPALAEAVVRIEAAVNAEACDGEAPPAGCSPAEHIAELTDWLRQAGAVAPRPERFMDATGVVDELAYGTALMAAVRALSDVLGSPAAAPTPRATADAAAAAVDRLAMALPLLDLARAPVGTGPYRLESYAPGSSIRLERRGPVAAGTPRRIEAVILRDPLEAATALQSGRVDWLPDVAPELVPVLESDPALAVGAHPSGAERVVVFNVRDGHPYADPLARQAFARCLDRDALVAETLADRGLPASSLVAPGSAYARPAKPRAADAEAARVLLEAAGYLPGRDGIYGRDGVRLSSEIVIRPGRAELSALMAAMARALEACGIELRIREVAFSPDVILPQLEWPNAFETYLATVRLGTDPALDLAWLDGDRVTTAKNPGDANFGGWRDKATDELLAAGVKTVSEARRREAYLDLQARLEDLVPAWPLVHEPTWAAISGRLRHADAPIDPTQPGYERNLRQWLIALP